MADTYNSENRITINFPDRRNFLKQVGLLFGGLTIVGTAASVLEACNASNPLGTKAGNTAASITISVATLTGNGMALVTSDVGPDGATIIVYRKAAGEFMAHSMACTHSGCQLDTPLSNAMSCGCHGSSFDLLGNVLRGPANAPLLSYPVAYDAGTNFLTIKFK